MKKLIFLSTALLLSISVMLTGCGEQKAVKKSSSETAAATTSASVVETTEKATKKETKKSSSKPEKTKKSSSTGKETVSQAQTQAPAQASVDYQKLLTSKKWNAERCYDNGKEQDIQMYYGSIIKETGAYLQFKNDGTFKCVMGFIGCKGTYTVDSNGKITVTKTVLNTGDNEKKINKTEKLKTKGKIDSIRMNLDGIDIVFI
ncbi:MAG: hypothetical protein IJT79_07430 [Ruminococcus sp.]|nr:hypothetical protein [Ruminococcus sp.]